MSEAAVLLLWAHARTKREEAKHFRARAAALTPDPEAEMLHRHAEALEQEAEKLEEQASALASEVSNRPD
jgi:hypothetical protein